MLEEVKISERAPARSGFEAFISRHADSLVPDAQENNPIRPSKLGCTLPIKAGENRKGQTVRLVEIQRRLHAESDEHDWRITENVSQGTCMTGS